MELWRDSVWRVNCLLLLSTKKQYKTLLRFLTGSILACLSLWYTQYIYDALQKVSLDGNIEWVVINQRWSTTRVVQTNEQQLLLQSEKQLTPWNNQFSFLHNLRALRYPRVVGGLLHHHDFLLLDLLLIIGFLWNNM